jgi:hypothetical protein
MKIAYSLARTAALASLAVAASTVQAAAPRAYVSVTGNDANVCSNPATPCRTFTGAIAQTTSGGEVVVLDSGTFGGGTISQAVTVNAPQGVVALAATAIIVNAGPSDVVTLRGITFVSPTASGTGLTFSAGGALNLENCIFHGWTNGLYQSAAAPLNVVDTTFRDNVNGAILEIGTAIQASFARTRFLKNSNIGLYVNSDNANVSVVDSLAAKNNVAIQAATPNDSTADVAVEHSTFANNNIALYSQSYAKLRVSASAVTGNITALKQTGAGVLQSRGNNTIEGNGTNFSGTIGSYTSQ